MNYATRIDWTGNRGEGTATYQAYGRDYLASIEGKPQLQGSADPKFRGDAAKHNPEDYFLIAIAACHMLSYLALCARHGINVIGYTDEATGSMQLDTKGGGRFVQVTLHPAVVIARGSDAHIAKELHEEAHERCFIAASVSIPIHHEATISVQD
jgi:organic hydroperoxide reductase OsmC/OhrA